MKKLKFAIFFLVTMVVSGTQPLIALAEKPQGYEMLAPISYLQNSNGLADIGSFIPGVVKLMIGIAAALAVLYLIIGGIKYMTTDAVSSKQGARETITNAIVGLLLAISSYTILYTLNPRLVNFNLEIPGIIGVENTDQNVVDPPIEDILDKNCSSSCTPISQSAVPQKPAGQACLAPGPCVVTLLLAQKLINLNKSLVSKGIPWHVTEMYPPTVHHADSCHSNGSCVDATITTSPRTPQMLNKFFQSINDTVGPNFIYEVCGSRLESLKNDPALANFKDKLKCPSTTTGESAHIEI